MRDPDASTAPVIKKYTGVLAAANIEEFTRSTTFMIFQSIRLHQGPTHIPDVRLPMGMQDRKGLHAGPWICEPDGIKRVRAPCR